jgi:hypothetical protein
MNWARPLPLSWVISPSHHPPHISYDDARKIAMAFVKSPTGDAKFGSEFDDCDDNMIKGYMGMYDRKALRGFDAVVQSRHEVRAMGLILEKQGRLEDFNKWAAAKRPTTRS